MRRDQHDTRTEKSPERSSNLTEDRNNFDDGPSSLGPNTKNEAKRAAARLRDGGSTQEKRKNGRNMRERERVHIVQGKAR